MKERTKDLLIAGGALLLGAVAGALLGGCGELGSWLTSPSGGNEIVVEPASPLGIILENVMPGTLSPWWLTLALAFFKRPRQNIVGAGQALAKADFADAGKHLAALTGLTHTPPATPGA